MILDTVHYLQLFKHDVSESGLVSFTVCKVSSTVELTGNMPWLTTLVAVPSSRKAKLIAKHYVWN
jgi:hypothetical protein